MKFELNAEGLRRVDWRNCPTKATLFELSERPPEAMGNVRMWRERDHRH
jgi:hypothetical protein